MNLKEIIQESFYSPHEVRPFDIMLMYQYCVNKRKGENDSEAKIHAAQTAVRIAIKVMRGKKKTEGEYIASKTGNAKLAKKKTLSSQDWLAVWEKAQRRLSDKWQATLQKVKQLVEKGLEYREIKSSLGVQSKLPWKKGK